MSSDTNPPEPIAIIGSGCRLPGKANSPSKLWELLHTPRDLLKKVDRFDADKFFHPDGRHHGTAKGRHAYLLEEDHRLFDTGFFGIKPVEAESIDPLQRLLLETVYESLEDAGIPMDKLQGSDTAFYAGIMQSDYNDALMRDVNTFPQYFATSTSRSIISNRVSYFFDWHGPSMTIDTACSSSMVALHLAVKALRSGDCQVALASGGNLFLGPELFIGLSKLSMLSSQGRSAMWDADVDGYGRGEAFVSVVMKRLSDAIRDGDHIDCVIRETGVNQDGRTRGITMPSATAQAELIRKTYKSIGLDVRNPDDQPQFFEAHGTGTKAGDPQEAEAIFQTFFGSDFETSTQKNPLYVGGIKTIIGHTEGTAGLAGLMKAMLSLRKGIITPNLLLKNLNPDILPFYKPLKVPTNVVPWPRLPEGIPRRASVNSFGFGGTNTHAILEYTPPSKSVEDNAEVSTAQALMPFLFSAHTEAALQRLLSSYSEYLKTNPETSISNLAWTLCNRRSVLAVKLSLSASSVKKLCENIDTALEGFRATPTPTIGVRIRSSNKSILGIFTGQGAQWAKMGAQLLKDVPRARHLIEQLEEALQQLPAKYRPVWTIKEELSKDAGSSRIQEAEFSQTLCTVVQVVLIDILKCGGIVFSAVVGHSSGEIAAAHAAGFVSAVDAVKIAYLRGYHASLSQGPGGKKGAMLAVGLSIEEASELCNSPEFVDRIKLAACNSLSSLTLSGDADAISDAKVALDQQKKFARLLKVDTAYHSHHMQPCAGPYVESLEAAGIKISTTGGDCKWYSSVLDGSEVKPTDHLIATYWRDNMAQTVLFSQAVTSALQNSGPFHQTIEVGPHPALKGPVMQIFSEVGVETSYSGTLQRGENDLQSVAETFGAVWSSLGPSATDFQSLHQLVIDSTQPKLLKGLPTYTWDHDKPYWYESRKSKVFRTRSDPMHELLGSRCDDGNGEEYQWRNFLSTREIPWLRGHQIQSNVVFPAAGYASMALEASRIIASKENIRLLEVKDLVVGRAIVFQDEKAVVEIVTNFWNVKKLRSIHGTNGSITADFTISAQLLRDNTDLTRVGSGSVHIAISDDPTPESVLAQRVSTSSHLINVDTDRFYTSLSKIGYGYTESFHGISEMHRRQNFSTGLIEQIASNDDDTTLLVHPSILDHAFQVLFGAYCWPGDGRLWTLFLPVSIGKISVDPRKCGRENAGLRGTKLVFDAWMTDSPSDEMRGDVAFSTSSDAGAQTIIQVENASMVALGEATDQKDRTMFFETIWGPAIPDGELIIEAGRSEEEERELAEACERVAYYYLRNLNKSLTSYERDNSVAHYKYLLLESARQEKQNGNKYEDDDVPELIQSYSTFVDMKMITSVGRELTSLIRGELSLSDRLESIDLLSDFFANSLGLSSSNYSLGRLVKQLSHRYPRMNLIEIGGGTGSSTQAVIDALDGAYSSYTFTDVEECILERMSGRFETEAGKVTFRSFDMYQTPCDQGFTSQSYDLVIASNVLGQASDLKSTLQNVRSLLKPGGYLMLVELTHNASVRYPFVMGALPGWRSGAGGCLSSTKWNQALREAGFGGVDAVDPTRDDYLSPFSIMTAQVVDEKVGELRKPLLKVSPNQAWNCLYILGGEGIETQSLVEDIVDMLYNYFHDVVIIDKLENILDIEFGSNPTILSLLDLEGPVFLHLDTIQLKALQLLIEHSRNVLWVTHAQDMNKPYANQSVGFFRTATAELPTLRAQVLDFDKIEKPLTHGRVIAESLLRLLVADPWEQHPEFKNQMLWTTEPELRFKNGKLWVPRVIPHKLNNKRLNGIRRLIHHNVDDSSLVQLSNNNSNGSWELKEHYAPKSQLFSPNDDHIVIRVRYSTLWAPRYDKFSLVLIAGQPVGKDQWVIGFTDQRRNIVYVRASSIVSLPRTHSVKDVQNTFIILLAEIIASRIAQLADCSEKLLLIYEPEDLIAHVLLRKAQERNFRIMFLTPNRARSEQNSHWIFLHPRESIRAARQIVPDDTTAFVYFGAQVDQDLVALVTSCVSQGCRIVKDDYISSQDPGLVQDHHKKNPASIATVLLNSVASNSSSELTVRASAFANTRIVHLSDLPFDRVQDNVLTVVHWQLNGATSVQISQPQPDLLFKKDKSYMLVGMTGEMGLSLARWMIDHGAGGVILTSRNPKINQAWIDEMEATGAKIKIGAFNATSRNAWVRFKSVLKTEMPPLAGIINGAVILQDQMFLDMDVNVFNDTLAPKIDITVNLDEVFRGLPLDFFIVFSSLSFIIGNRGQTNYNAGNAFVTSFVKQRRARGQSGSVIHLGSVVGVGYLTRAGDVMEQILLKYGYMAVSEVDLQHLVAQAIMAGFPHSGENAEMITGLRYAREDEEAGVHWSTNPRFSHMILPPIESSKTQSSLSTRAQLQSATSISEARQIFETSLSAKLVAILQMERSAFRPDAVLIELGVDSLVGVEIRSWALKEVNVDISVLRILGGASTIDLSQFAVEQMATDLIPNIGGANKDTAGEANNVKNPTAVETQGKTSGPHSKAIHDSATSAKSNSQSTTPASTSSSGYQTPTSSDSGEDAKLPIHYGRRIRLSSAQSRFWFLNMFLTNQTGSNVALSYKVRGRLRVSDFARAVKATTLAHESLRTCFVADEKSSERAWQVVMKESKLGLEYRTVSSEDQITAEYKSVRDTVYDLEQGETMRVVLLSHEDRSYTVIFGYHHIILDGVGFQIWLADLERAYAGQTISPQGLEYTAFSEQEGLSMSLNNNADDLAYWKREFDQIPPVLPLLPVSTVTSRQVVSNYRSTYVERRLDPKLSTKMKATCQKLRVTMSHFYLTTYRIWLARLTGVDDLCIGLADANRHSSNVMSTVGLFLNSLPLHFTQHKDMSFGEVLHETRDKVYEGLGHAGVPFDELLQALRLSRSSSHSPLFQAFFDYHQGAMEKLNFSNTSWDITYRDPGQTAYDITLDVVEGGAGSLVAFMGQEHLYGSAEMEKMLDCYITLLEQFVEDPTISSDKAKLFSQPKIDAALKLSEGPHIDFQWRTTIAHRVYDMCQKYPDSIAVKDGQAISITYEGLKMKALGIRERLLESGVKTGDKICVFQKPTPDWICSLIAIFWTGAVYVPLVQSNPLPRIAAMMAAVEPKVVLTDESTIELASQLDSQGAEFLIIDHILPATKSEEFTIPVVGNDAAVILFTSGSTGTPKGISVRHSNIVNHIEGYVKNWQIGRESVLQQSAFSFDLSMGQIFTALSMGGTLVVASESVRGDASALAALIQREKISWTLCTPSEYTSILETSAKELASVTSWKYALAAGEALTKKTVLAFSKLGHPKLRLFNAYGPAEAVITATTAEISLHNNEKPVTIGRPNPDYSIYIVDENCNPVPQGFPGEILIGGCGVAMGYLKNEGLTREKFVPNPFASQTHHQNGWNTAYRTGDKGRFDPDGQIRYEGRRDGDSQIKLRGYRIELEDIESSLLVSSEGVLADAIVSLRVESQTLVAHVIFSRDRVPAHPATYLAELQTSLPLPVYMKPTMTFHLEKYPKNLHGKIDRKAIAQLPLPLIDAHDSDDSVDLSSLEKRLVQTWRKVLPAEFAGHFSIGNETDFFGVGGNSLLLVKLQSRIRVDFDVSLELVQLFEHSKLSTMAARIQASNSVKKIHWNVETALGSSMLREIEKAALSMKRDGDEKLKDGKVVLLTGATGYFGTFLLRQLVESPEVQHVHCVAVRGREQISAKDRVSLSSDSRVTVYAGDLTSSRFGLSEETWDTLAATADLIIHSGSRRSFWDNYWALRSANVLSTKELLRLAIPRKVPIHFLSSSGVLKLNDTVDSLSETSVAAFEPPKDGSEGYVASKWASEVLLENANRETGVPVVVHRFTPRTDTSPTNVSDLAMNELLKSTEGLGILPERSTWGGRFDVIHSPRTAARICELSIDEGLRFVHHQGEASYSPKELFDFLEAKLEKKVEKKMDMLEWVGAIKRTGYGWLFSTHELTLTTTDHGVTTKLVNVR